MKEVSLVMSSSRVRRVAAAMALALALALAAPAVRADEVDERPDGGYSVLKYAACAIAIGVASSGLGFAGAVVGCLIIFHDTA